jgi:hypothetical protein
MSCNITDRWAKQALTFAVTLVPATSSQCVPMGLYTFFYSNWPEDLRGGSEMDNGVLWHDAPTSPLTSGPWTIGCWLWHENQVGQDIYAGMTLENVGAGNINITGARGQAFTDQGVGPGPPAGFPSPPFGWFGALGDGGQCIAQAQLNRQLDAFTPAVGFVAPGSRKALLSWGPLHNGNVYGAYLEFDLSPAPGTAMNWMFREVYGPTLDSLLTKTADPFTVIGERGDGRGSWSTNRVSINGPTLVCGNAIAIETLRLAADRDTGPDACWPASTSYDSLRAHGNLGKYGCLYLNSNSYPGISMPFRIQTRSAGTISLYLSGAGGTFLGAASVGGAGGGNVTHCVPPLSGSEAVLLASRAIPPNQMGATDAFFVGMAVGGAAATPFDISLVWTPS